MSATSYFEKMRSITDCNTVMRLLIASIATITKMFITLEVKQADTAQPKHHLD